MIGFTPLGTIHTALGLIAVIAGIISFFRYKEISSSTRLGKLYIVMTILTCLTGFGIFQRGGFNIAHVLGIVTLVVLAIAGFSHLFGRAEKYVVTVSYSATFFFHMIPGVTETFTRVPRGAPLFANPDDSALQKTIFVLFIVFLVGAFLQIRRLRGEKVSRVAVS
jgi:uncharacterized membrane protein